MFDSSSVAIEKSWTIIGDEDDKSKTIANYSNVWCVVQTCTYIPTSWINKEAKKIHESWCNFGFEKSFIIPDALIKRGGGDLEVALGREPSIRNRVLSSGMLLYLHHKKF